MIKKIGMTGIAVNKTTCKFCGNFDEYHDENDGYGGCDATGYTVHRDWKACEKYL